MATVDLLQWNGDRMSPRAHRATTGDTGTYIAESHSPRAVRIYVSYAVGYALAGTGLGQ